MFLTFVIKNCTYTSVKHRLNLSQLRPIGSHRILIRFSDHLSFKTLNRRCKLVEYGWFFLFIVLHCHGSCTWRVFVYIRSKCKKNIQTSINVRQKPIKSSAYHKYRCSSWYRCIVLSLTKR